MHVLRFSYRKADPLGELGVFELRELDLLAAQRQHIADFSEEYISHREALQGPTRPSNAGYAFWSSVFCIRSAQGLSERYRIVDSPESPGIIKKPETCANDGLSFSRVKLNVKDKDEDLLGAAVCRPSLGAIPLHKCSTECDHARVNGSIQSMVN